MADAATAAEPDWLTKRRREGASLSRGLALPTAKDRGWEFTDLTGLDLDAFEPVRATVGGLPATLTRLRGAGIWVVGLDDAADRSLFDLGDLAAEGICIVLGAEGAGLSRLVGERCDAVVSIPMLGRISSLNVSAAAALATYEVARHRR